MCLTLDRRTFSRVMGPLEEVLKVQEFPLQMSFGPDVAVVVGALTRVWRAWLCVQRNMATYGAVMAKLEEA